MISLKIGGIIVAAFIAGAFVASPELRAYAANTVGSSDIINESILSEDIKNGQVKNSDIAANAVTTSKINDGAVKSSDIGDSEVKAADIAADAVGASEIKGVTKLLFATCSFSGFIITANSIFTQACSVPGVVPEDHIVATQNSNHCFAITQTLPSTDFVHFNIYNACQSTTDIGTLQFSLVIFQN
jgi:hypothetical protein